MNNSRKKFHPQWVYQKLYCENSQMYDQLRELTEDKEKIYSYQIVDTEKKGNLKYVVLIFL